MLPCVDIGNLNRRDAHHTILPLDKWGRLFSEYRLLNRRELNVSLWYNSARFTQSMPHYPLQHSFSSQLAQDLTGAVLKDSVPQHVYLRRWRVNGRPGSSA